jgi:hypothetical protein
MIPQSCIFNPGLRGFHRRNFSAYRKVTMGSGGYEVFQEDKMRHFPCGEFIDRQDCFVFGGLLCIVDGVGLGSRENQRNGACPSFKAQLKKHIRTLFENEFPYSWLFTVRIFRVINLRIRVLSSQLRLYPNAIHP